LAESFRQLQVNFSPVGDGGGGAAYTTSSAAAIFNKEFSNEDGAGAQTYFPTAYFTLERKKYRTVAKKKI
jgi:hypothetical protein